MRIYFGKRIILAIALAFCGCSSGYSDVKSCPALAREFGKRMNETIVKDLPKEAPESVKFKGYAKFNDSQFSEFNTLNERVRTLKLDCQVKAFWKIAEQEISTRARKDVYKYTPSHEHEGRMHDYEEWSRDTVRLLTKALAGGSAGELPGS